MRNPADLYEWAVEPRLVPRGLPLIAGLSGFADAGHTVLQLGTYVLGTLEHEVLAEFEPDILLDYRARRPVITFSRDHISDYQPPKLALYLAYDELHRPFLFLHGYEPDFEWRAFSAAVIDLVAELGVSGLTWIHGVPMPIPHTRPIGVTVSGNRRDLIDQFSIWRPVTQVPGTALHLIEYDLTQDDFDVVGFVFLVPHYLGDTEYPTALITALQKISAATGLIFPTDSLRDAERDYLSNIDEQVQGNSELQRLIHTLEERHDSYLADNPLPSGAIADSQASLPSADEIAAELEKFLAVRRRSDDENGRDSLF